MLTNQQKRSASLPQQQASPMNESERHIQEKISLPNKSHGVSSSEYHNQQSPKLSRNENGQNARDIQGQVEGVTTEVYISQYCNPQPKQSGQPTQETEMRPLGQTVNYPSDTTIVARGFCTPNISQNMDNKDSVTEDSNSSDISQQSAGNIYRNPRPLPPVPH
ncbi:unnamed protein product [Acanthosepion pharaonis]|uniref:Uncharacterized protein n=1 Tax=Acanthosepion pharaonis TaxID=158019 RepID=A0A812B1R3_ACAPH|nr:unnamed protein product [Sepia pharaonis]